MSSTQLSQYVVDCRRGWVLFGNGSECWAVLSSQVPGFASASDAVGDAGNLVQLTRSDFDDELVRLVVRQGQPASIDAEEGDGGCQSQPLVPVDQRVAAHQRMQ